VYKRPRVPVSREVRLVVEAPKLRIVLPYLELRRLVPLVELAERSGRRVGCGVAGLRCATPILLISVIAQNAQSAS
jgi:hypothetical protein